MIDSPAPLNEQVKPRRDETGALLKRLEAVREKMMAAERDAGAMIDAVDASNRASACNLMHYVGLRRSDIREIQKQLSEMGLSSLGRAEAHVLDTVDRVLDVLYHLEGRSRGHALGSAYPVTFKSGRATLEAKTSGMLGAKPAHRFVRIMVTMPSEAAQDAGLVRGLLKQGMDCARINCAHDGPEQWKGMIENVRAGARETGRACKVLMDLPGPKLRTGAIQGEPKAVHVGPARDAMGHVTRAGFVWLYQEGGKAQTPEGSKAVRVPIVGGWGQGLTIGTAIQLEDARGALRTLKVESVSPDGVLASCQHSVYLHTGVRLCAQNASLEDPFAVVGAIAVPDGFILLKPGDLIDVTCDQTPGRGVGPLGEPARVPCTLPEVIGRLKPGEKIWFDDGKIGGEILTVGVLSVRVRVTFAREEGSKLKADKGINLPDSDLKLACMTDRDREFLPFAAKRADMIGLSFVREPEDVIEVQGLIAELGASTPVVMKIENRRAFENLPGLLLAAMRRPNFAVMIARGDLAVECGYERLAEVQEEVLWFCEAAHAPVVWATQVLDTLARTKIPTRAEVTDAAMAERAECVMLNKGPFILEAVRMLEDILGRMQEHQNKKSPKLRPLRF
jgi:pyruvate kinase